MKAVNHSVKMPSYKKWFYVVTWIPLIMFHIVTILLGLILVPLALMFEGWPKLLWLWGNDEEGCPAWWKNRAIEKGGFIEKFPRFWWYAVRNPVNNFRYVFKDRKASISGNWTETKMEAQGLIDRRMRKAYRWSYNGLFAGYRKIWLTKPYYVDGILQQDYSEMWIGWKVDSTVPGMGFTLQYRRNVEIGE